MLKRLWFGSPSLGHQVAGSSMFGVRSVLLCPLKTPVVVSPAVFVLFHLLSRFAEHHKPASSQHETLPSPAGLTRASIISLGSARRPDRRAIPDE
jgi:hypothetical protein